MKVSQKMINKMENMVCTKNFREALLRYKKEKNKKRLSPDTILDYMYEVTLFYRQLGLEHTQIPTLEQAQRWRDDLENIYPSKKTQAKKIPPVNLFLQLVCGYPKNSLEQVDNIERLHKPVNITKEQVMQMIDFAESKGKYTEAMMIFVAFKTATRKSVLHRILLNDLDFENNTILLRKCKGNKNIIVPMATNDMKRIKDYIDNKRPNPLEEFEEYLFITKKGKKPYEYRFQKILKYCAKSLNIKESVHPHALRRARVWDLRKQGWRWEEIILITGHKKVEYLMPYLAEENFNEVQNKLNENIQESSEMKIPSIADSDKDKELAILKAQLELERLKNENMRMALNGIDKSPDKMVADRLGYGNYDTY